MNSRRSMQPPLAGQCIALLKLAQLRIWCPGNRRPSRAKSGSEARPCPTSPFLPIATKSQTRKGAFRLFPRPPESARCANAPISRHRQRDPRTPMSLVPKLHPLLLG
jgi:hypothetical protein